MGKRNKTAFCSECGKENSKVNIFCLNCGDELIQEKLQYNKVSSTTSKSSSINLTDTVDTKKTINLTNNPSYYLDTEELNIFVHKKTKYYHNKFKRIAETGNKISWNWAAFFLNIEWLLYRKMYIQSAIFLLISLTITHGVSTQAPVLGTIVNFIFQIVFTLFANSIYFNHIQKELQKINFNEYKDENILRKKGGTDIIIPIVFSIIVILFNIF